MSGFESTHYAGELRRRRLRLRAIAIPRPRPELSALLVLAAVLNLWSLSTNGWANTYYSAAVRSMSTSWHAFLYGSFDPSGVMTVDKPPLALWVQALSARIFGFNSLSMLVPQALMGMATVALVYDLTRRRFGRAAGAAAGLVLALTPITVAISRHNNPDALLILCCTAALWFFVRALEDGRTRWIVLAGVAVGLGFEAKMGVALMVVPAIAAAWLWVAPRGRVRALRQLLAGGAAMVVVGGAWPVLMWLTPASDRPWIAGTSDNSIWSLILGYDGFGRLTGQSGGPQAAGGGGPGGGGFFGGSTGVFRLLNSSLGGQDGWLLGFALAGGLAILVMSRLRRRDPRTGWLIAVGGAFLTTAIAFSAASGIFHPYYVSLLAPFTAALVGGGVAQLTSGRRVARLFAPLAIAGGVATELVVLHENTGQLSWLPAALVAGGMAAAGALAVIERRSSRIAVLAATLGLLLVAPAVWSVDTLGHPTSGTFPAGGPATAGLGGGFGGGPGRGARFRGLPGGATGGPPAGALGGGPPAGALGGGPPGGFAGGGFGGGGGPLGGSDLTSFVTYVNAHGGGTIAVSSQEAATTQIIGSGTPVAGIGGFSGRESEVSVSWLANAVKNGQIRWVVVNDSGGPRLPGDTRVGSSQLMTAVQKAGHKVLTTSSGTLYDLQGSAAALNAAS